MIELYALTWKQPETRQFGIIGLYTDELEAEKIQDILIEQGDISKVFQVIPVTGKIAQKS